MMNVDQRALLHSLFHACGGLAVNRNSIFSPIVIMLCGHLYQENWISDDKCHYSFNDTLFVLSSYTLSISKCLGSMAALAGSESISKVKVISD